MKTIALVYRITDPKNPVLERFNQIDGNYRDSRVIGNTLYFVSTSDLRFPPLYMTPYESKTDGFDQALQAVEENFSLRRFAPEIRESYLSTKGRYLQRIRSSVASCKDVTFLLPDDATLKNVDFTPSFVSLSSINIIDPTAKMKSELLFGDVSQIHMSQTSLYITSVISQAAGTTSKCAPGSRCFAPSTPSTSSTLIHRYSL
jgi:Beta propeller domain